MSSNKYPSRYSDGEVSAAQFITEMICEKKASLQKKDLPVHFWNIPVWSTFFKQQIVAANGLLRIYSEVAIIRALKSKATWNIYSLRAPHLDGIIKQEQAKVDAEVKQEVEIERKSTTSLPRQPVVKPNAINKLKDL